MADETHGIELYAEDNFSKVFKAYDRGLKKAESQAASTARSISKSGQQIAASWGTGVEDVTRRMDALSGEMDATRAHARDLMDEMGAGEAAVGGLSGALSAVSVVAAAVIAVLSALAAVGAALWGKLRKGTLKYIAETDEVIAAQERVNAEWERASEHLAQSLIPLKLELLAVEVKLAEVTTGAMEAFKKLAAMAHATLASGVEQVKALGGVALDVLHGEIPSFEEAWERIRTAGSEKFREVMFDYRDVFAEVRAEVEEEGEKFVPDVEPQWKRLADIAQDTFGRIRKMQESYHLQMQRAEEDAARARAKAWRDYEKKVAKEVARGEKSLVKLTEKYEKDRAATTTDYQKRIAKLEKEGYQEREDAHRDFERQMRHAQERYRLDRIQTERRFQYELGHLIAEGDTLAIEELRSRYDLEQKEAEENQELQQRQARENQAEQIREAGRAAREELRELRTQLSEALAEQDATYLSELERQRQANQERLVEMAADFSERRRAQDENLRIQGERREEDYRQQLRELGENLGEQLREQDLHYGQMAVLLRQYYGAGGVADAILSEYHTRELERIAVTAQAMAQMAQAPTFPATAPPGAHPIHGMAAGGIVQGPRHVFIESGMTEAIVPLSGPGTLNVTGNVGVNVSGLESAHPADVNAIAGALARELTSQIRNLRRS